MYPCRLRFALLLLLVSLGYSVSAGSELPNFIVILTDDQGWGTTSSLYDPEVPESQSDFFQTPAFDRIVEQGMRFTQAYSAHPNCSPSRGALLTGRSPAALHLTDIIGRNKGSFYEGNRVIPPQHINALPTEEQTIPELLKQAHPEYVAAHYGKWHLGGGGPTSHGFDATDVRQANGKGSQKRDSKKDPKLCFSITRRSIEWMNAQVDSDRPFYLQVSHHATHLPYQSRPETHKKFKQTAPGERHQNVKYAAMIADMDEAVGQLLDAIDQAGISQNTYLIYTSDNGTYPTEDAANINGPLRGSKATVWEAGVRVPFVVRGPGIEANSVSRQKAVGYDILPTICDLAGVDQRSTDVEGGSLVPALLKTGEVERPRDSLVFHWPHYQHDKKSKPDTTIQRGNYKLHYWWEDGRVELFDLESDLSETTDLAADLPEVASDLQNQLFDYLKEINAQLPTVNEAYDPVADPALKDRRSATLESRRAITKVAHTVGVAPEQHSSATGVPAPLFVDPHYHGSCDPEIIWNSQEKQWWVFYTARRAKREKGTYVGTPIGVAASEDMLHWRFVGYCAFDGITGLPDDPKTRWAPGVLRDGDTYHMFVTYKDSAKPPWGGKGQIVHYQAPVADLLNGWQKSDVPQFAQPDPIDASLLKVGDLFHAYYRVGNGGGVQWARSSDLKSWDLRGKCPGGVNDRQLHGLGYQEAPYVFKFQDTYWMLTDPHKGLAVYRSEDAAHWEYQGLILKEPGTRPQDHTRARHPSVAVRGDRALLCYHVEPNRPYPTPGPEKRTIEQKLSYLQMAELEVVDGRLVCDRDQPIDFNGEGGPF